MYSATEAVCPKHFDIVKCPLRILFKGEKGSVLMHGTELHTYQIRTRHLSWVVKNRSVVCTEFRLSEATYSWSPSVGTKSNFKKKKEKKRNAREAKEKSVRNFAARSKKRANERASASVPVSSFNHDHSMRRWAHPTRLST